MRPKAAMSTECSVSTRSLTSFLESFVPRALTAASAIRSIWRRLRNSRYPVSPAVRAGSAESFFALGLAVLMPPAARISSAAFSASSVFHEASRLWICEAMASTTRLVRSPSFRRSRCCSKSVRMAFFQACEETR
ncbi:Uncharacterised protein [Mycobacteroides abscessus subsp. abscessus]|nr:Uncharacterised protein [Mycobacteroides abscessus subsp. abscessus]